MGELLRFEVFLWWWDGVDGVCEGVLEMWLFVCEFLELFVGGFCEF